MYFRAIALTIMCCALAACGDTATLPENASIGSDPPLPSPVKTLLPTIHIATASSWPEGKTPVAGEGLKANAFAAGLEHPRWLYVLPNGDVLVAESNAPKDRPDETSGFRGWISGLVQKWAGAGVDSPNKIILLRDADGDGIAEVQETFLSDLNSPFGMALIGHDLYVANTDAIVKFSYTEGATKISGKGQKVADLPAGSINHHWTKNILASKDGTRLYATVGSNSNVAENGIDKEDRRAAILEIDLASGSSRVFATGLRNPNGLGWQPDSGALWTAVNERDELGSDLVPDYMTSVKDGGFYGWPYSYYGNHVDTRVSPQKPELVAKAIVPDYALGNHTASLGLAFAQGSALPESLRNGVFIGQHGSWNRKPFSGYKVIFVPFKEGKPAGPPVDVLTGFLDASEKAQGRPVGVVISKSGDLLVADDVGNRVWRVSATARSSSSR